MTRGFVGRKPPAWNSVHAGRGWPAGRLTDGWLPFWLMIATGLSAAMHTLPTHPPPSFMGIHHPLNASASLHPLYSLDTSTHSQDRASTLIFLRRSDNTLFSSQLTLKMRILNYGLIIGACINIYCYLKYNKHTYYLNSSFKRIHKNYYL